jgi:uncharacterized protein (DUF1778 family)
LPYVRSIQEVEVVAPTAKAAKPVASTKSAKSRLEARIDTDLDELISEAAGRLNVTKTAFVTESLRDAALKVIARDDVTLMRADVFDSMMASIDVAEESPELSDLAALPRRIVR